MGNKSSKRKQKPESGDFYISRRTKDEDKVSAKDFELLRLLGIGSFGKVFLVRRKTTHEIFAMKVLRKDRVIKRDQVEHTKTERSVLETVAHPFLATLVYAFQTRGKLYMIMEYICGGELFFHLKRDLRFSEARARFYTAEILSALEYLHSYGIIYRDIKPENILLDKEGHIVLTDFGLSKVRTGKKLESHTFCGTPEYLAPEILMGRGHGKEVDWWSLGTFLYEMLTGLPPFYSEDVSKMYDLILHGELRFPPVVSENARSLLRGLLKRDPSKRLGASIRDAEDIKMHPFFEGVNWKALQSRSITPPFRPMLTGPMDVKNFDPMFTRQAPKDSYVGSPILRKLDKGGVDFQGFTYVADSVLQQQHDLDHQSESEEDESSPGAISGRIDEIHRGTPKSLSFHKHTTPGTPKLGVTPEEPEEDSPSSPHDGPENSSKGLNNSESASSLDFNDTVFGDIVMSPGKPAPLKGAP